jgi:hypothetical protein
MKICQGCRSSFVPKNGNQRRCRRGCGRDPRTALCARCGTLRINPRSGELCKRCAKPRALAPCPRCGQPFWPWANNVKHARQFCSKECAKRPRRPKPPRQLDKVCAWCTRPFTATTIRQRFCSIAHQSIAKSKRRKQRLRGAQGELPSLWEVYRRDGGRCGLCHLRVRRTFRWPDRRAASLDHIVPLSLGGKDDAKNVQLTHLGCNMAKQAKPCGSQLRLV